MLKNSRAFGPCKFLSLLSSRGHLRMDGLVERFTRTLNWLLMKLVEKKGKNLDKMLGDVLLVFRTSLHFFSMETTSILMHGCDGYIMG